jgi:hypothetical protein
MKESLRQWIHQEAMPTNIRQTNNQEQIRPAGITVERFTVAKTGDEVIRCTVEPGYNHDWVETSIGRIRINQIVTTPTRVGRVDESFRRSVKIDFEQDATELLSYRAGQYRQKPIRSRDIHIDDRGIGWDELSKQYTNTQGKPKDWKKIMIIETGIPVESVQAADIQVAAD